MNCIKVGKGTPDEIAIQLTELIIRPSDDMLPEGKVRIENPEFHLTSSLFYAGVPTSGESAGNGRDERDAGRDDDAL